MRSVTLPALKELTGTRRLKVGTYVAEFATPAVGRLLVSAGCDYVLFGMEHSGFSMETTRTVLRYFEAAGLPAIVHVPTQDYRDIANVLDIGAEGVMTPMVATAEQARAAVACMKYPPSGRRGCGGPTLYEDADGATTAERLAAANRRSTFFALVETAQGVDNIEAIAAVEGVDGIWVGQLDLSISLGIPNELDHPRFRAAIERVAAAGKHHGKALALLAATQEQGEAYFRLGYDFICYGEDTVLYRDSLADGLARLRAAIG